MKLVTKIAFAVALVAPVLSQAAELRTRAQVRAELIQLEGAGYDPVNVGNYPQNLKHAETVVAQQNLANTAYGSDAAGASQSSRMTQSGAQ